MKKLLQTSNDTQLLVLRLALGAVIFPHGAQKMLGWFNGFGFDASMAFFTDKMGLPAILGFLAIAAEFFGALGLITGTLTRVAALGVGITMLVAGFTLRENGFFMNWFGNQKGEGIEFFILAVAMAVPLVVKGAGAYSVDGWLSRFTAQEKRTPVTA
jgi:putative oxidoreductase